MAKKMTLEESFAALDTLTQQMQEETITLEEAFQKYEAGMKLIKSCSDAIDQVEKKLMVINTMEEQDEAARG